MTNATPSGRQLSHREKLRRQLAIARAVRDSMDESVRSDPNNIWKHVGYKVFAVRHNEVVEAVSEVLDEDAPLKLFEVATMPGPGDMPAIGQKNIYESVRVELSILIAYIEDLLGLQDDEVASLANFVQARLRSAVFREPSVERDVQDCLEQLLIGRGLSRGLDYDREVGRVKVSAKEVVPDFIFPRLGLALEVKLVRPGRVGKIVDEINADMTSYAKAYSRLMFVLYDFSAIRDEREFRSGLEREEKITLVVVKH